MSDTTDTNTQEQSEWQKREIGALWLRQSPNQKYFSGHFTTTDEMGMEKRQNVVIFSNKHKKKDNHPDFRIYKSEPRNQDSSGDEQTQETQQAVVAEEELI